MAVPRRRLASCTKRLLGSDACWCWLESHRGTRRQCSHTLRSEFLFKQGRRLGARALSRSAGRRNLASHLCRRFITPWRRVREKGDCRSGTLEQKGRAKTLLLTAAGPFRVTAASARSNSRHFPIQDLPKLSPTRYRQKPRAPNSAIGQDSFTGLTR